MRLPFSLLPAFCLGIVTAFALTSLSWLWLMWFAVPASIILARYSRFALLLLVFLIGLGYSLFRIEYALFDRLPLSQNRQIQTLEIIVEDISRQEDYGTRFFARVLHPAPGIPHKIILTDYEKEQLVLEFYNAFKGVDYTKAAKINFLKQKAVLNEKQKQKIEIK